MYFVEKKMCQSHKQKAETLVSYSENANCVNNLDILSSNSQDVLLLLAGPGGLGPYDLKHWTRGEGQSNSKRPWIW